MDKKKEMDEEMWDIMHVEILHENDQTKIICKKHEWHYVGMKDVYYVFVCSRCGKKRCIKM